MHSLQGCKFFNVTPPGAIKDNTGFTTNTIDTIGFRELTIIVQLGATDIAVAALKLSHSDASNMSPAVDLTGADFSVSPLTLPSSDDDNGLFAIFVNLQGKKRYMDLTFTAGDGSAGTYGSVIAILSRAEESPDTATERGLVQQAFA